MASPSLQHPKSATTVFLDQPPSCLQFCPASRNHFIVGTYLLSENKDEDGNIQQTKTGSLQLWKLDPVSNTLSLIQRVSLPYAVFDLHFHPRNPSILAIATSAASVALFSVSDTPEISHLWTLPVHEDSSIPALFLAWVPQNWLAQDQADGFAVSFSDGRTTVFGGPEGARIEQDSNLITELGSFNARETIEVWFVALATFKDEQEKSPLSSLNPFLFTGDDFGSLHTRRFEIKTGDNGAEAENDELLSPLLLDHDDRARHHTAGVTSILPLPLPLSEGAPLLLTGSYDESLRVYHATRRGQVLAQACLGGGVWRLQLLKTEHTSPSSAESELWKFLVLASCMHAGTRVVRVTCELGSEEGSESQWNIDVLAEFTEHESMNYASDVWKAEGGYNLEGREVSELLCVSSSFYDKRVCMWRVNV